MPLLIGYHDVYGKQQIYDDDDPFLLSVLSMTVIPFGTLAHCVLTHQHKLM